MKKAPQLRGFLMLLLHKSDSSASFGAQIINPALGGVSITSKL